MDQEIKEGRGCGPNKDYVLLEHDHLGAETITSACPRCTRSASTSPTSTSPRSRSRWCRPSTTRWAASRPTSTARSWCQKGGDPTRSSTACTRWANAPASACTAPTAWAPIRCSTCWCSAARPATTSSSSPSKRKAHKPLPADAADRTLARLAGWRAPTARRVRAGRGQRHPRRRCSSTPACSAPRPSMDEGVQQDRRAARARQARST